MSQPISVQDKVLIVTKSPSQSPNLNDTFVMAKYIVYDG